MKKRIVMFLAAAMAAMCASAAPEVTEPEVTDVTAKQRFPWNGLVDIDYTINGDAAGLGVLITVRDNATGMTYTPSKFLGPLSTGEGTHRVTWSTEADGLTNLVTSRMVATVALMRIVDAPTVTNDLYMVIDLSGGANATSYPISYLSSVPNGGMWPDEYKTTKLVMRKIEPGTFTMGDTSEYNNKPHEVSLTKPFYCGVFEVTQKQYELVMGNNPSVYPGDKRAVEHVSYNMLRGEEFGSGWPSSGAVDDTSFMGKIRMRTALQTFDLPTEAQWEYACRAGTTNLYNNGGSTVDDLKTLGRYLGNRNDGRGGYVEGSTTVGSYAPNAWGLYDMHGNVNEWCLDRYQDWHGEPPSETDPVGASSGSSRILRGGGWNNGAVNCHSSSQSYTGPSNSGDQSLGFRLVCPAGQ